MCFGKMLIQQFYVTEQFFSFMILCTKANKAYHCYSYGNERAQQSRIYDCFDLQCIQRKDKCKYPDKQSE